ncbi:unnamed protein product, partial [Medioppia subpectinata]
DRVARDVQVPDLLQHSVNASVWADKYPNPLLDANKAFDKLTEVEVIGMSMSMLGAGYETTASQLCYITRILALKPWYQTKLVDEIHNTLYTKDTNELSMDYEKLQKMSFLDAFIKEVMRVNCSVTRYIEVDRIVTNDTYLEGIYLPKNTPIIIPIWALHIDPDHFPEPMEFKPERFLPDNIDTINPYTYLPFATGPRNCIGFRFALLELKYTLVKLLCRYEFVACNETKNLECFNQLIQLASLKLLTIGLLWQKWRFWKRQGIPTDWSARSGQPFHISDNECHRKHGKVVGFYEGLRPCLSITDPNLIRKVLVTDFHKFANHRELPADSEPIGKGVFFTPYPQWKRIRALHSTAFTTGRLKAMLPIMSDTFDRLVTLLDPKARDSQVVDFRTVYDSFTFDVITRAVASIGPESPGQPSGRLPHSLRLVHV